MAGLAGEEAWRAESRWSRQWLDERFDQSRLASERENIVARGRAQSTGLGGGAPA
jgi:hypothetical protein